MSSQMKNGKTMDMTEGSPLRLIVLFTIPIILGNIFQQLYNIGDAKVVSFFLNEHAFAAVGMTGVVSHMLLALLSGFTQGFGILTANAFGAKSISRIRRYISGSAILTAILTLVLTVLIFILIRPLLEWLNTPETLMEDALSYIRVILLGTPFVALYNLSANLLRSLGDSRTPLYCLIASIILNLGLDLLFVGAFGWGIRGAAIATILSQAICALACFLYGVTHFREYLPGREDWKVSRNDYHELFLSGLSMGLMLFIVNVGTVILQGAINSLGPDIMAAHTAGRRLIDIMMTFVYTIGVSMTTYVSQNYGAGRFDRIRKGVRVATVMVLLESAVLILFAFLFARGIVTWIASTDIVAIQDNATLYARVMVCFFPVLGPLFILRCTLQGVGQKIIPLSSSIMEFFVKIVSAMWLTPWLGYLGVALTEPISWVLMLLLLLIGYIRWCVKSKHFSAEMQ